MLRKFVTGLVFGAGFAIALIAVLVVYLTFFQQPTIRFSSSNTVVDAPPDVSQSREYLGAPATYTGDFIHNKVGVLATGPGEIVGNATVNGMPVSGLRLRLALNGSVLSQWATTDASGEYIVKVPYGQYRIDGFELDHETANTVLAGKIDYPYNSHASGTFSVDDMNRGHGLSFKFVDPVRKAIAKTKYSAAEKIVLDWEPYPDANRYIVQIYEKDEPYTYIGRSPLFSWSERPSVTEPSINLAAYDVQLIPGRYYLLEIEAYDEDRLISTTGNLFAEYDFELTE